MGSASGQERTRRSLPLCLSLSHHYKPVGPPIERRSLSDSERRAEKGLYCPVLVCVSLIYLYIHLVLSSSLISVPIGRFKQ